MVQPKLILCRRIAILGLMYTIICSLSAMLQHVHSKTSVLVAKLHSIITACVLGNRNRGLTLATTTTEESPALSSQHPFSNKTWYSYMQITLRYLCLLFAISICTYLTSPTTVVAQSLPQISLGFTMIDGRIGSTEAVEGEIVLFSIQSDRVVSRALDVTVNVSQTGNFIGTVRANEPLANQFTHGVLGINTVTIAAGRKVAFIGIATDNDQIDEENGTVSVLLAKESTYSVKLDNPSDRQKTINVNDNDDEPVFSLATKYTKVSDSDFFEVSVIPSIKSEKQFAISLSITPPSDLTGLIASANQSATVNVAPLASAQIHKIDIASVATNTANGHPVTVVINSSESYQVNHSKRQVQVNIVDDDSLPSPTISAVNSTVNEGEPAIFNIGFTNANTTPTQINLALTSEGDYLNGLTNDTIVIPAGATSYNYAIPTIRDSGAGGSITVTLEPGDGYKLPNSPSAMVTIATSGSTQTPVLFLDNIVEHSEEIDFTSSTTNVEYTIHSNVDPGTGFSVSYLPTNLDGNFIGSTIADTIQTASIDFSAVSGNTALFSATLPVPVVNDTNRKSGIIQVTLLDPTGSTYSVHKVKKIATTRVINDTSMLPVISITGGGRFEEGQDGIFYVQADRVPSSPISVTVGLGTNSMVLPSTAARTISISSTMPVPLSIPTTADSTDESDGTVTATIQAETPPTNYEVSSDNNHASITIVDNDVANVPVVEVSTLNSIFEGRTAYFTLTATTSTPLTQPLKVNIDLLIEGNIVENVVGPKLFHHTVTIPISGRFHYEQMTYGDAEVVDRIDSMKGKITVTIRAHETNPASYSVGQNHKASTNVIDDDYENTVAVSVVGGGDIVEGENASFTIRTDKAIETDLPVNITIRRNGTFFEHNVFLTPVITLPATSNNQGESSHSAYIYHIPTRYDQVDEPDGSVTISISDDPNSPRRYSVGANPSATVVVMDDDEPGTVVSLHSDFAESGVTINKSFTFSVHTTTPVLHHTYITIEGKKIGDNVPDFVDSGISRRLIVFAPGTAARTSPVEIQNCSECPANFTSGRYVFTVIVNPSLTNPYVAHPEFGTLEINIKNSDVSRATHPVISITPTSSEPVFAGENARYTLTSSQPITKELTINYWVSYQRIFSGDNPAGSGSVKFTVDSVTPNTHILEIPINKYREFFDPAKLPVQIQEGVGYAIGVNSVAEVTVLSDISISLKSSTVPITEGQIATFTFMSTKMLPKYFELNVRITDPGNYLPSNTTNTTKIILNPYGLDSNKQKFLYNLKTELDGVITAPNIIRMEILPGENYQIGTNSVAEIAVNDGNTKISVIPLSAEVTKGNMAHFRVAAVSKNLTSPPVPVVVKLGIVGNPNSIYTATNRDVNLRFTNGRVYEDVSIMTIADNNTDFELDGRLIVYIKNPDGSTEESYNLPSNGIYIGDNVAVMKVVDDDIPTGVSILPLTASVIEGERAEFQITANSPSGSDRTINLIGSRYLPSTVTLPASHKSVIVGAATPYNPIQQEPGEVVLSIETGSGYTPSTTNNEARMVLLDAIVPEFRLVRSTLRVPEFSFFDLEFAANPVPQVDYNVKFSFSSGYQDDLIPFQSSYTFKAGESSLIITRVPPAVTKDELQVWSISIEPADLTQGRGRAHFTLPITILNFGTDATLTKPKVAVSPIDFAVEEGSVASFKISVDHGDKMFNTVENNKIVNKVSSTVPPTLVHFRLIVEGDPLPDYFTYPDPSDYSSTVDFNTALREYREKLFTEVPSLSGCTSYENLRFSCWVHESRNGQRIFNFPTVANESAQKSVGVRILVGEEQLLTNYLPDPTAAFSSIEVLPGALPVITVSAAATQESGRLLRFTIHADPAPSAKTTIFFDINDPAGLVTDNHNSSLKRPKGPFAVGLNSGETSREVSTDILANHASFIPDDIAIITILPSVPIVTGLAEIQYIVGPKTGTVDNETSVTRVLLYHNANRSPSGGVSILAVNNPIQSGETAIFNIKTNPDAKFTEDTTIKLVLDRNGSDVISGPQILMREVLIPAGSWSGFLYLDTIDLPNFSEARTITARLQLNPDSEYTITSDNNFKTASITVNSYSQPVATSVQNVDSANSITEGEISKFKITLALPERIHNYQPPENGFYIYYKVSSIAGNFIQSGDTIGLSETQNIAVSDLDFQPFRDSTEFPHSCVNILSTDKVEQICRIEINDLEFQPYWDGTKFNPDTCINNPNDDKVDQRCRGDMDNYNLLKTFEFSIRTQVDKGLNNGGKVSVTLLDDPSSPVYYKLNDAEKTAQVNLNNNHASTPVVSISKGINPATNQQVDTITEGGEVRAVVTIDPPSRYRFVLKLKATETGDFLNVGRNGKNIYVDFATGVNKQEFNFDINDDNVEEDNGMVTFTIRTRKL